MAEICQNLRYLRENGQNIQQKQCQIARVLPPDLASLDVLNRQCHRRAVPACAFLARVLRIDRASLDRVLSKTAAASLRSYTKGSYKTCFTVQQVPFV